MIEGYGLARVALVGNPSDGCYGKTLAVTVGNFRARALVYPSARLEVRPGKMDLPVYESLDDLCETARWRGYHGGSRLVVALLVRLREYCREAGIELEDRNFTVEYESTVPPRSGLGGASAILTATLRAVLQYYGLMLPLPVQANLIWETERYELGMDVGPQGRVAQTYEGLVYMDFGREMMEGRGYGAYEWLDPGLASGVYVAYRTNYRGPESGKGVRLRAQWRAGEPETVAAMRTWAAFAEAGRKAMLAGDRDQLHALIDSNLDLRMHMGDVEDEDAALARAARALGASANLAGSGGAIAGFYDGPEMFERLRLELSQMGARVMRAETGERREEGRV